MSEFVQVQGVNFEELKQALRECPQTAFQFVGNEMKRGGNRFRKRFIAERMRGRPGIRWSGAKSVGGNVKSNVSGRTLADLKLVVKLSRFLAIHETGATIKPVKGAWLYLRAKGPRTGTGQRRIVGRVRSVTVPPRLGFRAMFNRETPELLKKLEDALARSIRVAFERRVKTLAGAIRRAVA